MTETTRRVNSQSDATAYRFIYFSQICRRPICIGKIRNRIGRVTDLVVRLIEPYPEAVGIYIEHGWGKPTQFIPWEKVVKIEDDAIFVNPPDDGGSKFPEFVDQPGWILIDKHLMGRTILDMDGRRIEVVNDVHLLQSHDRILVVHVDISFSGFLRRWKLDWLHLTESKLISWRYVQPLSLEDAIATDTVSLSITRKQVRELPSEDLADVLEELSGQQQEALFSALDSEKAAEALVQAEPRAQRQLISSIRREKARTILSEMSVPQLADLFSVLPHEDVVKMMELLPADKARRIKTIISERESTASSLVSSNFMAVEKEMTVGEVLKIIRSGKYEEEAISYVYVLSPEKVLTGVVDVRQILLSSDDVRISEIMISPVVTVEADDLRDDIVQLFAKYHYRMLPVVDSSDHMLGVIHYNDVMKSTGA